MTASGHSVESDRSGMLWEKHRDRPSERTLVALLEHYVSLVQRTVASMAVYTPPDMDRDDLVQHALIGLWSALDRFDGRPGVSFESYALPRIRGAVRDALRRHDPLSRKDRSLLKSVSQFLAEHAQQDGGVPDDAALAEQVGLTVEQLHALWSRAQPWLSLDATGGSSSGLGLAERLVDAHAPNPHAETVFHERAERFRKAFRKLPVRQQKILYLYYYEDLTLKEIGEVLDLTEARICQLHGACLFTLRSLLTPWEQAPRIRSRRAPP